MRTHSVLPPHCPYRVALESFEREMLARALEASGGVVGVVSDRLGVSRKYLYDRFKALGMAVRHPRVGRRGPRRLAETAEGTTDEAAPAPAPLLHEGSPDER